MMSLDLNWANSFPKSKTAKGLAVLIVLMLGLFSYPIVKSHSKKIANHYAATTLEAKEPCFGGYTHVIYAFYVSEKGTFKRQNPNSALISPMVEKPEDAKTIDAQGIKFTSTAFPINTEIKFFNYEYSKDQAERQVKTGSVVGEHVIMHWNWPGYIPQEDESGKICSNDKCFDWKMNVKEILYDHQRCGFTVRHCLVYDKKEGGQVLGMEDCNKFPKFGNPTLGPSQHFAYTKNVKKYQ
jgi:hypothetical protein